MICVVLHSGLPASGLRRSESKRPFSRRGWNGSSSGGLNSRGLMGDWKERQSASDGVDPEVRGTTRSAGSLTELGRPWTGNGAPP